MQPISIEEYLERWQKVGAKIPTESYDVWAGYYPEPISRRSPLKWHLLRVSPEEVALLDIPDAAKVLLTQAGLPEEADFQLDFRLLKEPIRPFTAYPDYQNPPAVTFNPSFSPPVHQSLDDFYAISSPGAFYSDRRERLLYPNLFGIERESGVIWCADQMVDETIVLTFMNTSLAYLATSVLVVMEFVYHSGVDLTSDNQLAQYLYDNGKHLMSQLREVDPVAWENPNLFWPSFIKTTIYG